MATKRSSLINIHEARATLSTLLRRVQTGEEIVIAKNGRPVARLVPLADAPQARELGFAVGQVGVAADFDAPLPTDVLAGFEHADRA